MYIFIDYRQSQGPWLPSVPSTRDRNVPALINVRPLFKKELEHFFRAGTRHGPCERRKKATNPSDWRRGTTSPCERQTRFESKRNLKNPSF